MASRQHSAPEQLAITRAVIVLAVLTLPYAGLGWLVADGAGLRAGLLAGVVSVVLGLVSLLVVVKTKTRSAQVLAGGILVSYLVKVIGLALVVTAVNGIGGIDRGVFGFGVLAGLLLMLGVEGWVGLRTRQAYIEPGRGLPRPPVDAGR